MLFDYALRDLLKDFNWAIYDWQYFERTDLDLLEAQEKWRLVFRYSDDPDDTLWAAVEVLGPLEEEILYRTKRWQRWIGSLNEHDQENYNRSLGECFTFRRL